MTRFYSDRKNVNDIDSKTESSIAGHKLEARPDEVSAGSSVHPIMGEVGGGRGHVEQDTDMMAGVRSDLVRNSLAYHTNKWADNIS